MDTRGDALQPANDATRTAESGPAPTQPQSLADYKPPEDLPATDVVWLLKSLAVLVDTVTSARTHVAGCTTRLNLSKLDLAIRDAAAAIEAETMELATATRAILSDTPLPVEFPDSDRWPERRQWCVPGTSSELLSPRQLNYLAAQKPDPSMRTITYREALKWTDAIPQAAQRHISSIETDKRLREAYDRECPHCGAAPGKECVTSHNRPTSMHAGRLRSA